MKHALTCLIVAALTLTAFGCSEASGPAPSPSSPAEQSAGPELTIAVSVPAADHGWTAGVGWWARRAMDLYPDVNWVYATAQNPEKQISDIKDMMAQQKLDGMVVLATESAPLTPIAKQVHENGIYLVNVDRGFLEPVADLFIEGDNEAFGRKSAEFMVDKLDGKGRIIILEGIPSTVNTDRVEAAMEVFDKHPDIEVLASQSGMWNREKSHEVMKNLLTQHPDFEAIWAADDDMALGVEQALKEAGKTEDIWILGGAGMNDIVKRVMEEDPLYPADITYPPSMIAVGIHMCVSNLRDGKMEQVSEFMPQHMKLDVQLITPENAGQFYFPESVY
jgi:ribose transport system substrate-binding protein